MLVIGFKSEDNFTFARMMDHLDIDEDTPRKIHDALSKEASGVKFNTIVCVENDEVLATYDDDTDYDLSEEEDIDEDADDEGVNPDHLQDVDEDDIVNDDEKDDED